MNTQDILKGPGLSAINGGAWSGTEWHAASDAPLVSSLNPATGEAIAQVRAAGVAGCVDNVGIIMLAAALANTLGTDIADLPLAAAAPEWYSEKAAAIACYAVASGVMTVLGPAPPILGSTNIVKLATEGLVQVVGATFAVQPDPIQAADLICRHLERKRPPLGLPAHIA